MYKLRKLPKFAVFTTFSTKEAMAQARIVHERTTVSQHHWNFKWQKASNASQHRCWISICQSGEPDRVFGEWNIEFRYMRVCESDARRSCLATNAMIYAFMELYKYENNFCMCKNDFSQGCSHHNSSWANSVHRYINSSHSNSIGNGQSNKNDISWNCKYEWHRKMRVCATVIITTTTTNPFLKLPEKSKRKKIFEPSSCPTL